MNKDSHQKNWDAALIKTWRTDATLFDTIKLFSALCGERVPLEGLLRLPRKGFPWSIRVRIFVANHLSKISNRLWEQDPLKDILLLRKLQTSKYDTERDGRADYDLQAAQKKHHENQTLGTVMASNIANRNSNTDWHTVK